MDVVPARVAIVEADQDPVAHDRRYALDLHPHLFERGKQPLGTIHDIHAVEQEVLVAALVVDEQDLAAARSPEVTADRARLLGCQSLGGGGIARGRDPDIEYAIARRDPAQPLAVGADPPGGLGRIAEQRVAWDQWNGGLRDCGSGHDGGRGSGGKQQMTHLEIPLVCSIRSKSLITCVLTGSDCCAESRAVPCGRWRP